MRKTCKLHIRRPKPRFVPRTSELWWMCYYLVTMPPKLQTPTVIPEWHKPSALWPHKGMTKLVIFAFT